MFLGREGFVYIIAGEVALFLGELDQFLDLFAEGRAEFATRRFAGGIQAWSNDKSSA